MTKSSCIKQYNMASRLKGIDELYKVLSEWRKSNPEVFRIDGHHSIGPANPAQWIFFEIDDFKDINFKGTELGKNVTGTKWNGIYYLTASTRAIAVDYFINTYETKMKSSQIFNLTYTSGKEGIPSKRKIILKGASDEINSGWFCKQFYKKY